MKLGLPRRAVEELARELDHTDGLLSELWVPEHVAEMVRSAHNGTWFELPGATQKIRTNKGGRQGCPLGALIFKLAYSRALYQVQRDLLEANVVLHLPVPWASAGNAVETPIAEATYVDDQLFLLEAGSPTGLDQAIQVLLKSVVKHFPRNGFLINWKPGKTEAFLQYVGHRAKQCHESRLVGGKRLIKLPAGAGASHMTVVKSYKHLGGIVAANGTVCKEGARRVKQGAGALKAIERKLLRSKELPATTKINASKAFSQSRLLYNVHTWTTWPANSVRQLESVYMKGIRASMSMRWGQVEKPPTNYVLLRAAELPSLECIVRRRRLLLFARALWHGPISLVALIMSRPRDVDLPWLRLLRADLHILWYSLPQLSELPDPNLETDLSTWASFIRKWPSQWKAYVSKHFSVDSSVAPVSSKDGKCNKDCAEHIFLCQDCSEAGVEVRFKTQKALDQHSRKIHSKFCTVKSFIDSDGRCPGCHKLFASRLRCVAHVTDKRRGANCKKIILSGAVQKLPDDRLRELDAADSAARKAAREEGHTQPLVPDSRR